MDKINNIIDMLILALDSIPDHEIVDAINIIRRRIHEISPFKNEPVDFVEWVKNDLVIANDYNPNKVAPPEMQLLEVSIINDGYTQPIVTFPNNETIEVVDGFHRSRVGKESITVKKRVNGYLPVVSIRKESQGKSERIASTIRHNRARGKHQVSAMSEIVIELKNRNWSNNRIARELGMDEDEILRLCQISGIEYLFKENDFNHAWVSEDDNLDIFNYDDIQEDDMDLVKIPNENDENRIFHTHDKWESVEYDFFASNHRKWTKLQCEHKYIELMTNLNEFEETLNKVIEEWPNATEHNLTNKSLNRIAWLGQAAMAYRYQIPAIYSSGWQLLDTSQKEAANEVALRVINNFLHKLSLGPVTMEEALQIGRQVELY